MGLLMYKDIPYSGGGTDVEANPSGSATEDLTKLGIDDTNYNVADADYRSDQKTYTFKVYDTSTHKYGSNSVGSTTTIRGVISAISALFDSVKTAINDHADVFTAINTAISSINTALNSKADTTNATYTKLTGSGHRFGDIDISQSAPFTSSDVSTIENANMAKIKTIVNNLADYAEENAGDVASTQTATGNPLTLSGVAPINAEKLEVVLEPKQDLHGQSYPYVGGAGKNKLPMTVDGIKAVNTAGTWSGNTYTFRNIAFTILTDNDGNVTGINANGTNNNSSAAHFTIFEDLSNSCPFIGYELNGCPTGGGSNIYYIRLSDLVTSSVSDYGTDSKTIIVTDTGKWRVRIEISPNVQVTNKVFYPMISSDGGAFAPYSNICPISGYDSVSVDDVGKNVCKTVIHGYVQATQSKIYIDNDSETALFYAYEGKTYTISSASDNTRRSIIALSDTEEITSGMTVKNVNEMSTDVCTWTATWTGWTLWYKQPSADSTFANSCQVEEGSTATQYEPYHSSNATIQFGTTVYGGKSDFVEGGTSDEQAKLRLLNTQDFRLSGDGTTSRRFAFPYYLDTSIPFAKNQNGTFICSHLRPLDIGTNSADFGGFYISHQWIVIPDKSSHFADLTAFQNWLQAETVEICYEKATASTINTPPTPLQLLKNTNNLSTDGTNITIGYQPDNVIGELKEDLQQHTEMEWLQVKYYGEQIDFKGIEVPYGLSSSYEIADDEFLKHRFILVEFYYTSGSTSSGQMLATVASALLSVDTLLEADAGAYIALAIYTDGYLQFNIYLNNGKYYAEIMTFEGSGPVISGYFIRARLVD